MSEKIKVYNFEVQDWHTYFVGNQGVLVHNRCDAGGLFGIYEDAPYHTKVGNSIKSKAPINGQEALDNSLAFNNGTGRIGISNGEFVVLSQTSEGLFHGHVRTWSGLSQEMQNALRRAGLVNKRGKIIG